MKKTVLFLSLEDVIAAGGADMDSAVSDIRKAFRLFYEGKIVNPLKTSLKSPFSELESSAGLVNCMPAYVHIDGGNDIFSCKILGAMPDNVKLGLPRATGLIVLFDAERKTPEAVIDAQVISAMRTGAVSSLAAEKFMPENLDSIALVGAGVNMRTQLMGISKARPSIKRAHVFSRAASKYDFAEKMSARLGIEVIPETDCAEMVRNSRAVVTCLPNITSPVVKDEWIGEKGMTCFNIGCYEMETSILARMDRIVADMWEQGKHRGAQTHAKAFLQGVIPESRIEDLAPVLAGEKPGRVSEDENIFFNPTGLSFEDAVVADRIYRTAVSQGIGKELVLWDDSSWI